MPTFSNFHGIIESKYESIEHYIQKPIQEIIDTQFKGIRCAYFPKGILGSKSLQLSSVVVCDIHNNLGFSIEIHSNDYGFLDGEGAKIAPAYAHVLDEDEMEIGLLNITGECPRKISDIKECRTLHVTPSQKTPLMKCRRNIIKWANSLVENKSRWESSQELWSLIKEDKR
jgi:hypothetical protein